MKSLKGTQTEANLLKAFAGESQARNRYTYFASQAKKEFKAASKILDDASFTVESTTTEADNKSDDDSTKF